MLVLVLVLWLVVVAVFTVVYLDAFPQTSLLPWVHRNIIAVISISPKHCSTPKVGTLQYEHLCNAKSSATPFSSWGPQQSKLSIHQLGWCRLCCCAKTTCFRNVTEGRERASVTERERERGRERKYSGKRGPSPSSYASEYQHTACGMLKLFPPA